MGERNGGAVTLEPFSARALKEWAAIERLLATGDLSLMLRKGGLWERRDGFEMEHRQFWLFPTLYHQNPQELRPELSWALEAARESQPGLDQVRLEHFALVTDAFRLESLDAVAGLRDRQALTPETLQSRFHYRNRPYLHALLVRVHRVPDPHVIPNTLGYEGCVSWVELDSALSTAGATPVLDDRAFAATRHQILGRVAGREDVVSV
jgi:hypothetical protein